MHEAQTLGRPGPSLSTVKGVMTGKLELVPLEALAACGATPTAGREDAVACGGDVSLRIISPREGEAYIVDVAHDTARWRMLD